MREKRQHQRVGVRFQVLCLQEGQPERVTFAKDISFGGMFVELMPPPSFGTTLTFVVEGLASRTLNLPATVRWTKPDGCGVQFGLLGAYETHAILDFIKKHKP